MRTYGQLCGLAKALDVVGDRWSLLIVRELLIRDACRYTDLREGLPGIATNLLADRLRQLEQSGIVEREDAPPPVATTLFRLTERGKELRRVIQALGLWGIPLVAASSGEDEEFRGHWLALPLEIQLAGGALPDPPVTLEVHAGEEEPVVVEIGGGEVRTRPGRAENADGILTGTPRLILGTLVGGVDLEASRAHGLEYEGDPEALRRLVSAAPTPTGSG